MMGVRYLLLFTITCALLSGCADTKGPTTRPMSARERQEQALRDPYGYGPSDHPSISGGGTSEFDKKAFKRDMDSFWNP